jgi:hypothetical protein
MLLSTVDNGRPAAPATAGDGAPRRKLYETMVLIRLFEEETDRRYKRDRIGGYRHLCIGQEGATVGGCAALEPDDLLPTSYLSHGFALARGVSPEAMMAELFGRVDGCARGRGARCIPRTPRSAMSSRWGIVGGQLPLAVGAAFTLAQVSGTDEQKTRFLSDLAAGRRMAGFALTGSWRPNSEKRWIGNMNCPLCPCSPAPCCSRSAVAQTAWSKPRNSWAQAWPV